MSTQVMVDLETMGVNCNAVICTIGAVKFDTVSLELGDTFYKVIDFQDGDGIYSASTIKWWLQQQDQARMELSNGIPLIDALVGFSEFYGDADGLYGNASTFDNVVLQSAYETMRLKKPWHYRHDKCYRTIANMFKDEKREFLGVKHKALDDAINQANHLMAIARRYSLTL